jgi:serine/threonine-protein kinase
VEELASARELLGSRYDFEQVLGEGGYATVFRVRNRRLGRIEALKILKAGQTEDREFGSRFLHEAQLAASLDHPNIASVFESGEASGVLWYTLRFIDGETLSHRVAARGPLDAAAAARLALPLLDALAYSHARGIVHRDIKPDNILVDARGHPHIVDFGIAKSPRSLTKTQTGVMVGTPAFISPEQARGLPVDGRSDLYSLGTTLYFALSGRYPFEASDGLQAVILRLTELPKPLSETAPGTDPAFETIVMTAIEREPGDRFPSARQMKDAVDLFLRQGPSPALTARASGARQAGRSTTPDEAVSAPGSPTTAHLVPERPELPLLERRPLVLLLVVLVVLVAAGFAAWVFRGFDPTPGAIERPGTIPAPAGPVASPQAPDPTPAPKDPAPATLPKTAGPASSGALREKERAVQPAREGLDHRPVEAPQQLPGSDALPSDLPESCAGVTVDVSLVVGRDGVPREAKVISRGRDECSPFALRAAREWKFRPALDAEGRAVDSRPIAVAIQF